MDLTAIDQSPQDQAELAAAEWAEELARIIREGKDYAKARAALEDALKASEKLAELTLESFNPYRFDPGNQPPANVPTLYLDGVPVCNRGNISSLVSHKKMGKSRTARAILRAICSGGEHLGFTAPAGRVAYLDFEQSRADFHHLMQGVEEREEGRLLAYSMAGATIAEGRALVDLLAPQDDLRAILLDGWADLVADVNDPEESNEFVRWAMSLAAKHDISILGLLHLNPGSETKSRGHLGSQLERKAETQLEMHADGEERIICAPVARHRPIFKDNGVRIAWSDEAGDFVRIEGTPADAKQSAKVEEWTRILQDVEASTGMKAWKYGDLWGAIAKTEGVKERTAKSRIQHWIDADLLTHSATTGNYTSTLKD